MRENNYPIVIEGENIGDENIDNEDKMGDQQNPEILLKGSDKNNVDADLLKQADFGKKAEGWSNKELYTELGKEFVKFCHRFYYCVSEHKKQIQQRKVVYKNFDPILTKLRAVKEIFNTYYDKQKFDFIEEELEDLLYGWKKNDAGKYIKKGNYDEDYSTHNFRCTYGKYNYFDQDFLNNYVPGFFSSYIDQNGIEHKYYQEGYFLLIDPIFGECISISESEIANFDFKQVGNLNLGLTCYANAANMFMLSNTVFYLYLKKIAEKLFQSSACRAIEKIYEKYRKYDENGYLRPYELSQEDLNKINEILTKSPMIDLNEQGKPTLKEKLPVSEEILKENILYLLAQVVAMRENVGLLKKNEDKRYIYIQADDLQYFFSKKYKKYKLFANNEAADSFDYMIFMTNSLTEVELSDPCDDYDNLENENINCLFFHKHKQSGLIKSDSKFQPSEIKDAIPTHNTFFLYYPTSSQNSTASKLEFKSIFDNMAKSDRIRYNCKKCKNVHWDLELEVRYCPIFDDRGANRFDIVVRRGKDIADKRTQEIKPYIKYRGKDGKISYFRLNSCVKHLGSSDASGHYICYVNNPKDREWYKYDDGFVQKVEGDYTKVFDEHFPVSGDALENSRINYMISYVRVNEYEYKSSIAKIPQNKKNQFIFEFDVAKLKLPINTLPSEIKCLDESKEQREKEEKDQKKVEDEKILDGDSDQKIVKNNKHDQNQAQNNKNLLDKIINLIYTICIFLGLNCIFGLKPSEPEEIDTISTTGTNIRERKKLQPDNDIPNFIKNQSEISEISKI